MQGVRIRSAHTGLRLPSVRTCTPLSKRHANVIARAKKDDAAKKALQELFEGKKDILKAYDRPPPPPGGGDGGGGGGGGFNFNWGEWFDGFKKWWAGLLSTLATIVVLVGVVLAFKFSSVIPRLISAFFRLDGPRTVHAHSQAATVSRSDQERMDIAAGKLSENEADLIAKYGTGTEDVYHDDDDKSA